MQKSTHDITIFLIVVSSLILTMILFIISIIKLYKKKQQFFGESIQDLHHHYEKAILDTRLEIQEQTFQHISREIHDNINLLLTLAKLHLNTIDRSDTIQQKVKIDNSVELISKSITSLSNLSKGLNSDLICQQGLIKALEEELNRIVSLGTLDVKYSISGEPVFMDSQRELITFRIIQEALNNIIKHADAKSISVFLHYDPQQLFVNIIDDGNGFVIDKVAINGHAGLINMKLRSKILGGEMEIESSLGKGTTLNFKIPYNILQNA